MGQVMRLVDVIDRLSEFDSEDTIYAAEPWTEQSDAIVTREPDVGGLPPEPLNAGMKYLLEVDVAQSFLEDWLASLKESPSRSDICERLIKYAVNDA